MVRYSSEMLLAEEYLLLSLDEKSGREIVPAQKLRPALAAALLAELALVERIRFTPRDAGWHNSGRVIVTSTESTGDAVLDQALRSIEERKDPKVASLVSETSTKRLSKGLRKRLAERLVETGVLQETRTEMLEMRRWYVVEPRVVEEIRGRLHKCLIDNETPTDRTLTLVALLHATKLLGKVVHTDDRAALKDRVADLSAGDWAGRAVQDAIDDLIWTLGVTMSVSTFATMGN